MNKSLEHSTCSSEQTKSTSQVAYATFDKVDSFEVEPTDDAVAGMQVRVAFGVVHLFRSLKEAEAHKPTPGLKPAAEDEAVGTVLGMISVPASLNASKLLAFLAPAREAIQHMRVIRQDEATSIMVLLKFRATLDAEDFFKMYNGQPFDALDRSVTCQLVYVTAVTASQSATLPHAYPLLTHTEPWPIIPSEQSTHNSAMAALQPYRAHSGLRQEAYELPTCPVCLERLDARLSGLITVLCQHTFHCDCLERWTDSRCPVCRYAAAPMNKELGTADGFHTASSECVVCHTTSDLWVCLICANVGCGRYKQGHAQQHFQETGHLYSLEMQTQRVWDYAGDGYVHRLIQSSSGGKLVELPSASNAATLSDRLWNARYPSAVNRGSGSEHAYSATTSGADDIELLQEKMEALGLEYSNMILSQLDSQRVYYESRLATQRTELVPRSELLRAHEERDLARNALNEAHQRCDELAEQLAVSTTAETRRDAQLRRALEMGKQLRRELDEEKCVSDGLYKRVEQLQSEQTVLQDKVSELSDELRDLMFFVSARDKIDQSDEALGIAGGTAYVPEPSRRRK